MNSVLQTGKECYLCHTTQIWSLTTYSSVPQTAAYRNSADLKCGYAIDTILEARTRFTGTGKWISALKRWLSFTTRKHREPGIFYRGIWKELFIALWLARAGIT